MKVSKKIIRVLLAFLFVGHSGVVLTQSKTPILDPEATLVKLAFGSCADEEKPQPIWSTIIQYKPQLFLFLGDNVYGDKIAGQRVRKRFLEKSLLNAYQKAEKNQPEFNKFRQTTPHMMIWDDHDYGANDAGRELPFKEKSKTAFLDFWKVGVADIRRERDGIYYSKTYGPQGRKIQIIMLDTRTFRSGLRLSNSRLPGQGPYRPNEDISTTILGKKQWRWLKKVLKEKADIRFIVSSVQVIANQHKWEKWGNFPHERQKLYSLLVQYQLKNVFFISGDRHFGAIYQEKINDVVTPVEITASSLTNPFSGKEIPDSSRIGRIYSKINFGSVEIDWKNKKLILNIRNLVGMPVISKTVQLFL